jgi:peptidoglycan/LPS O-acetylase OafA/YrhL
MSHYSRKGEVIFAEGDIGVEFFYILSGFIISYTYKNKFKQGKIKVKDFLVARIARIYPLHCLTFLLFLIVWPIDWLKAFLNLALLQSFVPLESYYFSFNSVSWSISCEMFFYLCFPLLLFLQIKFNSWAKILFLTLFLISYFLGIYFVPEQYHHAVFYVNPFLRIFDFIIGMGLFNIYEYLCSIDIRNRIFKNKIIVNLIEIIPLLLLAVMIMHADKIPQVYRYDCYYWLPIILIIITYSQIFGQGIITKMLSHRFLFLAGKISFGFYMLHNPILLFESAAIKLIFKFDINQINELAGFTIIFLSVLAASLISFYLYETPANKMIKKISILVECQLCKKIRK